MQERRQDRRVATILEATWHAQSGAAPCRVTDLGLNGCFVQALYAPAVNDETSITVAVGENTMRFTGTVRYVEALMGFGMRFEGVTDSQAAAMRAVLER